MLRLEATLIATMVARPWRTGWTLDRGVDFVVRAPMPQMVAPPDIARAAAEPVSFLDADEIMPGSKVVRRYVSLAARKAGAAAEDRTERPLARAWSSVARKVPGS
ncbi:MAG: hypothetical protein EON89_10695 [Brevundimonas sp.]|nr:MAG: hypothetical protein EON89_10695 [Brevundimonas sp.]